MLSTEIISLPESEAAGRDQDSLDAAVSRPWGTTLCEITPFRKQIKTCQDLKLSCSPSEATAASINTRMEKKAKAKSLKDGNFVICSFGAVF